MSLRYWGNLAVHDVFSSREYHGCGPMDTVCDKLVYCAFRNSNTPSVLNVYDFATQQTVYSDTLVLDQQIIRASGVSRCAYYAAAGGMWALDLHALTVRQVLAVNGPFYVTHDPDSKMVVLSNGILHVFSVNSDGSLTSIGSVPATLNPCFWSTGLTLSEDGRFVACVSGQYHSDVSITDLTTGIPISFNFVESPGGVFSPVVTHLLGSRHVCVALGGDYASGCVYLLSVDLENSSYTVIDTLTGMGSYVYSVAVSTDRRYLLAAGYHTVRIYDLTSCRVVWAIPHEEMNSGVVTNALFSDDMSGVLCAFSGRGNARLANFSAMADQFQLADA